MIVPRPVLPLPSLGIDPALPTAAPKGSVERLAVYQARDVAGLPLYHPDDSQDVVPIEFQHQVDGVHLRQSRDYGQSDDADEPD